MMKKKVKEYGIQLAIKMCNKLIAAGAPGLHFYTMNEDYSAKKILEGIDWTLAKPAGKRERKSQTPQSRDRSNERHHKESNSSNSGSSHTASLAIAALAIAVFAIVSKSWHWW